MRTAAVVVAIALSWSPVAVGVQQPSFRAGVDLIAVDAQVVDRDGSPIESLEPADFDVSLNGRRRRVVSADFHRYGATLEPPVAGGLASPKPPVERGLAPPKPRSGEGGRIFIIAVDASSFEVGAARAPLEAAQAFVAGLGPQDYVGLYTYPNGPRVVPTRDRVAVRQGLLQVTGERMPFAGIFYLRPSEVVDITAMSGERPGGFAGRAIATLNAAAIAEIDPVAAVQQRECPDDAECVSRIVSEARAMALHLEAQAARSLGGLQNLLQVVTNLPGRKTVVLVTAGVVVSDRPGGRPDVGDLATVMGQVAARSNATLYTVHIDAGFSGTYSAAGRRTGETERARDRTMTGDWLDRFSAAAGGARIHVPVGAGEFAFERVLRETSGVYLLGVEPEDADRDGRPRQLRVRLPGSGPRAATIRHRQWVVVQ
jgi:VWFA-related protein